jgi:cold shock CspA family protein
MASGTIIQFNSSRGYGFIEPDDGGEDVFIHSEELREHPLAARPGTRVLFNVLRGQRGLKASDVTVLGVGSDRSPAAPSATTVIGQSLDDESVDVVSAAQYRREITDTLIDVLPSITASDIVGVRDRLCALASQRGWLED